METIEAYVRAHAVHDDPPKPKDRPPKAKVRDDPLARGCKARPPAQASFKDVPLSDIKNSRILAREILRREYGDIPRLTLTIDCETEVDSGQKLRFVFAAVHGLNAEEICDAYREGTLNRDAFATLKATYCFHDLMGVELALLQDYCEQHNIPLYTRQQFANCFKYWAYTYEALVIGHNLFFDLTRIAVDWVPSRGVFEGGFTLIWCDCHQRVPTVERGQCWFHPAIRTRKLGPGKVLYQFVNAQNPDADIKPTEEISREIPRYQHLR